MIVKRKEIISCFNNLDHIMHDLISMLPCGIVKAVIVYAI